MGKDFYYWNGQKRRVKNHPPEVETTYVTPAALTDECERMCQTVPANTEGWMQDVVISDREHKINLATATKCNGELGIWIYTTCDEPWEPDHKTFPKKWETFNYIETYSDQADMCAQCA